MRLKFNEAADKVAKGAIGMPKIYVSIMKRMEMNENGKKISNKSNSIL